MSLAPASATAPDNNVSFSSQPAMNRQPDVDAAITKACARIAPLWPLKHFVAVNPFLGFSDRSFAATCATLRRVSGIDMLMPRIFYRKALAEGMIEDRDLVAAAKAIAGHSSSLADPETLRAAAGRDPLVGHRPRAVVATIAETLDRLAEGDRQASHTAFMIDEISKWCAAYFDEGQSAWRLPSRGMSPYKAWRSTVRHDRNPEMMGVKGFRAAVAAMPDDPRAAIADVLKALVVPERAFEDYLYRALSDISGWAGYVRYRVWDNALAGREDDTLVELLAIRVVWGYALFLERTDPEFKTAWADAMADAAAMPEDARLGKDPELGLDLALHEAYEAAHRRRLLARLKAHVSGIRTPCADARKAVQAAFCIDVRSEVYRRALETISPDIETIGFAGFFGFPIEYVPIGRTTGGAQCPVLLKPAFIVCEEVKGASQAEAERILSLRLMRRRAAKAWKAFKLSAVSSFTYVETAGLLFAGKLVGDSARLSRPVSDPDVDGLDAGVIERIGPRLEPRLVDGRETGFDTTQRVDMAEAVLRAMSLIDEFARLVLLTGHGSTTVNNPHASSLDCGACGGHSGEANARVATGILNDKDVRRGLAKRGISIPADTWFVGALHDTTTDEVRLFGLDQVPPSHVSDLAIIEEALKKTSALARAERALLLGVDRDRKLHRKIEARSRDWAQVRPEWGLAGNDTFIAAPRERTRGLDLGGRAFLHDYDWQKDAGFRILDLIMTAPMVVASWINLQYYGSTVNNRAFGSGNKVLHNVVGQIGVLEGNAGDLRVGLPLQSVHNGKRFIHEPIRLSVFIAAPEDALNSAIARHEAVHQLVDNRWIHLFRLAEDGAIRSYSAGLSWDDCQ